MRAGAGHGASADKWGLPRPDRTSLYGRGTEGACIISPECPKTGFYRSTRQPRRETEPRLMPGLFSCTGESKSHRKQSRQTFCRSRYTPAKRLLGAGTQTPEKSRQRRSFSSLLTGRPGVLRTLLNMRGYSPFFSRLNLPYSVPVRARNRSTSGAVGKAAQAALAGGLGGPQQAV